MMNYYHTSYTGGSSGKLIAVMVMFLVERITTPITFCPSELLDCHHEWNNYEKYLNLSEAHAKDKDGERLWTTLKLQENSVYNNIYAPAGEFTDYDSLISMYPNFKEIKILVNFREKPTVEFNHYIKAGNPNFLKAYESLKTTNAIKDLTPVEIDQLTQQFYIHRASLDYNTSILYYNTLSEEIKKNIFLLNYSDIFMDTKKVLSIVSEVAEQPVTPNVEDGLMQYVDNHFQYYRKNLPWCSLLYPSQLD